MLYKSNHHMSYVNNMGYVNNMSYVNNFKDEFETLKL